MNDKNPHLSYRPDIDGLRAFAVISVVIFHAFPDALRSGFIGVDVFFIISGFLISSIIIKGVEKSTFSFRDFYARRVKRIFPALILVLTTSLLLGWFCLWSEEYKALGRQVLWGAGFSANFLMQRESGYFDTAAELKPLLHLWSLGIEEQFYLIWPVLLYFAYKLRLNLLLLISGLLLTSFWLNWSDVEHNSVQVFFNPLSRFWELWIGASLAYWVRHGAYRKEARWSGLAAVFDRNRKLVAEFFSCIGILLMVIGLLVIDRSKPFPGALALLPTLGAALIIAAGPHAWINRTILASRPFVGIGLISYPLYLWHWPLLSFTRILEQGAPSAEVRASAVALSVILAALTYLWLERRLRFSPRWTTTAALSVALFLVALGGAQITRMDGAPSRIAAFENFPRIESQNDFYRGLSAAYEECGSPELKNRATYYNGIMRCRQTEPMAKPVSAILLGDSHAEHLFPGLASKAFPHEKLAYLSTGCLPFWVATKSNECKDLPNLFEYIASQKNIHTVILANFWQYRLNNPENLNLLDIAQRDPQVAYTRALTTTFEKLIEAKKDVVFIFDVPTLDFSPEHCRSRPYTFQAKARNPCAISRADMERGQKIYRSLTLDVLKNFPSVKAWDPAKSLCDENWCSVLKDGTSLYRDNHHLTTYGSDLVSSGFIPKSSF